MLLSLGCLSCNETGIVAMSVLSDANSASIMGKRMLLAKNASVHKPTLQKIGQSLSVLPNIETIMSVNTKDPGKSIRNCHMTRRKSISRTKSSTTIQLRSILQSPPEPTLFTLSMHLSSTKSLARCFSILMIKTVSLELGP
jgi:hypothetical protein